MLDGLRRTIAGIRRSGPELAQDMSDLDPAVTTLVACVGDSITKGSVSSDYVAVLRDRLSASGFAFVNEGVNGNLAWNALQRLDATVARQPDVVTLLIGTNDVNATLDEKSQRSYRRSQGLPSRASLPWFQENVAAILDRLAAETDARVLVLDIPMLGEDLSSDLNRRVDAYNATLREICTERAMELLPLHDRLAALLPTATSPRRTQAIGSSWSARSWVTPFCVAAGTTSPAGTASPSSPTTSTSTTGPQRSPPTSSEGP